MKSSRTAIFLATALIIVWAVELLIIQEITTNPGAELSSKVVRYALRRFGLNLLACTALLYTLNRFWLYSLFVLGSLFSIVVTVYAGYFNQPMSWMTFSNQWQEGLANTSHGIATISIPVITILVVAFVIKVTLIEWIRRYPLTWTFSKRAAILAGVTYFVAAIGYAGFYKPISRTHVRTPEYTYGYMIAWAAEFLAYDTDVVLADAIAKASGRSHLLTKSERPLEFGDDIVVIQVESLDFDALNATSQNELVMPFLHDLKERSMFYMVEPFHFTGTCDADFSLLTASPPNGIITPFKVYGFPYDRALPRLVSELGYSPSAIHGNTGGFFQRRAAYQQMGFSKLYFGEELKEYSINGRHDHELFNLSAKLINESPEPIFHFIITWTSHGPFKRLPPETEELIPEPNDRHELYLNNMRYVDDSLERYYEQLPENTTVVIYGDHHSDVTGYVEGEVHANRVPWIICRKDEDLSTQQKTMQTGLAMSGELGQLEMVCFLWDNLEAAVKVADQKESEHDRLDEIPQ
jgi:phosphoglycerol transferase MdoB-like AlkP superfamily enzyme